MLMTVITVGLISTNAMGAWYYGTVYSSNILIADDDTSSYAISLLKEDDDSSIRLNIDPALSEDIKKAIYAGALTAVSSGARIGLSSSCPSGTKFWCQISVER